MQSYALKLDPQFIFHLFFPLKYSLTSWTDILKLGYLYSCLLWLEKRDWASGAFCMVSGSAGTQNENQYISMHPI